jgi:5-methylcytosine-specific restriction protein B
MLERLSTNASRRLYDRDHCIGHAYFTVLAHANQMATQRFRALADHLSQSIVPLLEEYFFRRLAQDSTGAGDNQKPDAAQFMIESDAHEQDLSACSATTTGSTATPPSAAISLQESAFSNPAPTWHLPEVA